MGRSWHPACAKCGVQAKSLREMIAIFFLVFVGALTLLFGWAEKKLDYFR